MEELPVYIGIVFGLTTALAVVFLYKAGRSWFPVKIVLLWLAAQSMVSLRGFYTVTDTPFPRPLLLVVPPLLFIAGLFLTSGGRSYLDRLDTGMLTLLHIVRIPVEITLFLLFLNKAVPRLMTFEGGNLDILSGLSAPFIYFLGYVSKRIGKRSLLIWNFVCLGLLINIVVRALLSAPSPLQKLAFDQPNIAILHFPFVWLPAFVVPVVLFSHLVTIRRLLRS